MPFSPSRSVSLVAKSMLLALATSVLFTAGCGIGSAASAVPDSTTVPGASISGLAHGGQQGISGATVDLRKVGTTGYGAGSASLLTIPVYTGTGGSNSATIVSWTLTGSSGSYLATFTGTNDFTAGEAVTLSGFTNGTQFNGQTVTVLAAGLTATTFEAYFNSANASGVETGATAADAGPGYFNITEAYSCTGNPLVYLTVSGGNSGGGTNTAIKLVVPLGACNNLTSSTFVYANEVTTAAAAYALGNFYTTAGGIGSHGASGTQSYTGLTNAFATVNNLVSTSTGAANTGSSITANSITMTYTPEATKLNTVANILAACVSQGDNVNFPGTNCSTLFTNAPSPTTPTDTMQAAVNIVANPFSNVSNLYALQTAYSPFTSDLGSAPTDFSLGINYNTTSSNSAGPVYKYPQYLAVDGSGNIWTSNDASTASLTEISPTGTPLLNVLVNGSTNGIPTGDSANWLTIDPSGNVYVSTYVSGGSTVVAEYPTSGTPANFTVAAGSDQMASDGAGNIFVVTPTALWEITSAGSAAAITGTLAATGNSGIAVDKNFNVYVTGATTTNNFITPYTYSAGSYTLQSTSTNSAIYDPFGMAVDNSGNLWIPNDYGSTVAADQSVGKYTITASTGAISAGTAYSGGGLKYGQHIVLDGAGNVWVADETTGGGVAEFSSSGTALSPAGTTGAAPYGFVHGSVTPYMIGVDPSGNLWVGDYANNGIEEIVGAAVPVVTPIAAGLPASAGGTSTLASKP